MAKISRAAWLCAGQYCLCLPIMQAAAIFKADTAYNLNLAASWNNSVAPGGSDVATRHKMGVLKFLAS